MSEQGPTAHRINLPRYFARIGYRGAAGADLATLQALTRLHCQSIPFENLDVLLQRGVRLDVAALEDKLVIQRRGGYCFEQNGLLLAVLRQLGFDATPLGARIRLGRLDRTEPSPRTHMLIKLVVDGQDWITDVGIGSTSLTAALRLLDGPVQRTPHEQRRLERDGERWFHQVWRDGRWLDIYEFSLQAFIAVDRQLSNWYRSTHPESPYVNGLIVALARPRGRRLALAGTRFSRRAIDGRVRGQDLASRAQLSRVLTEAFGLEVAPDMLEALGDKLDLPAGSPP